MALLAALLLAAAPAPACTGRQLAGSFTAVRGSAGAGNIVYALVLRNVSRRRCFVSGIPQLRLLDRRGRPLPTHARPELPGAATAVLVSLAPGEAARATARFSPDVPGVGEPVLARACEPTAYFLRVVPNGGGALRARIRPPTPVCEHGGMSWRLLQEDP